MMVSVHESVVMQENKPSIGCGCNIVQGKIAGVEEGISKDGTRA
jgi:hypothetical protein